MKLSNSGLSYARNARGLVTRIATNSGNFDFSFDALGRRSGLAYPNGSTVSYGFDPAGQLANLTHTGVFNAPYVYTYDAAGRITRVVDDGPGWNYSYDALGRLTRATDGTNVFVYTLDAVGNILDGGRNYDVNHRLVSDAAKTYSYDPRGNLTLDQDRTTGARTVYTWNVKNQLQRVDFFAAATGTTPARTLQFTYDPLGRRASKTDNGLLQRFVYDGNDLVGTLDNAGNVGAANVFSGAIDEPLASIAGGSSKLLYANHLGSVTAVADGATLTHAYRYGPYGQTLAGSGADSTPFRHTGREKDTDSLYFYRARYYSTAMQRFLQSDPIGLVGGINAYAYVEGNPVNYTDPTGECPWCIGAAIGGAAGGLIGGGWSVASDLWNGRPVDWGAAGRGAVSGAIGGAVAGATFGLAAPAAGGLAMQAVNAGANRLVANAAGAGVGALSGALGDAASQAARMGFGWQECFSLGELAWATALGGAFGGIGREWAVGNGRIAPFGNRVGNPNGTLPHYHRGVANPANPGQNLPGQGMGRHRPWDSRPSDTSFWDRF